jgi:preprotein translocase subunit SecF
MRKAIQFTRARVPMMVLSLLVIGGGIAGIVVRGGLDLSVDLSGGVSQQIQIADVALTLRAPPAVELAIERIPEDLILNRGGSLLVEWVAVGLAQRRTLTFAEHPTVADIAAALELIEGVVARRTADPTLLAERLRAPGVRSSDGSVVLRSVPPAASAEVIPLARIREVLAPLGGFNLQGAGAENEQTYIIRTDVVSDGAADRRAAESEIFELLADAFGVERINVQATDFVGPSLSRFLGRQAIALLIVAFALTFIYIVVRFKWSYAVGAIVALVHDVAVMLGVLGTFQLEVSTATIAAVLTIVGYSLNDTIVIFDRVRENVALMRDSNFKTVINVSVTQSLGRTIITSLTTLLAVTAIYVFGSASIQTFALALIIGVGVGTYSSIFVASPVLLLLHDFRSRRTAQAARAAGLDLAGAGSAGAAASAGALSASARGGASTAAPAAAESSEPTAASGQAASLAGAHATERVQSRRQPRRRRKR